MRIFTRYILREVLSYAVLGGILFTFVLFMRDLPKILDLLVRDSASLAETFRILGDMLPTTLIVTIPIAVLTGVLLGLSRLAADSEVTAMRACGIGAFSFVRIVSILGFAAVIFGLLNNIYLAPRGASDLLRMEDELKTSQVSIQVQPRVFYENFRNHVLYVQSIKTNGGSSVWKHVFLADLSQPTDPDDVITANEGVVANSGSGDTPMARLHLSGVGHHQIPANDPNQYDYGTFDQWDLPLQFDSHDETHISRTNTHIQALSIRELWNRAHGIASPGSSISATDLRAARIELNSRFSYPFACLVLMLIGVPLGLSSRRGGKSTGFVLTLLLVFAYYLLSNVCVAFARSGKVSPFEGVWAANFVFAIFGLILLQQLSGAGVLLNLVNSAGLIIGKSVFSIIPRRARTGSLDLIGRGGGDSHPPDSADQHPLEQLTPTLTQRIRRQFRTSFPLLLDEYVMKSYGSNFLLSLGAFVLLYIVFTFLELMGDIVHNQTPFVTVGEYLFYLVPFIISEVTPFCSLLAALITFGALNRSSELTAMKATGISLYRVVSPILVLAAMVSVALFAFNETYLPSANRHQEQLRAEIKGKPAQTFLLAGRKWISGQPDRTGEPARIFYYQAFDPERNAFLNLSVFEFDPQSFTLSHRIFAANVHWDRKLNRWIFDDGWERTFSSGDRASYRQFPLATFPEIHEQPGYFKKEDALSDEMSYTELHSYIADLRQSGFDTVELAVQLQRKLAVPAVTLIMAIIAVPFAVSMGKRPGLAGIAAAIGVAIGYWVLADVFSSMGNINTLPPLLAAWSPDLLFGMAGTYLLLRTPT